MMIAGAVAVLAIGLWLATACGMNALYRATTFCWFKVTAVPMLPHTDVERAVLPEHIILR